MSAIRAVPPAEPAPAAGLFAPRALTRLQDLGQDLGQDWG